MESLFARASSVDVVECTLPSGNVALIRRLTVRFGEASPNRLKPGALPASYVSRPLVTFSGAAMFGELAVLRWLEADGWEGVWLDTAHDRKNWRHMPTRSAPVTLPSPPQSLYDRIIEANGGRASGAFDVMAWRGDHIIFVEYHGPDETTQRNQRAWIDAALVAGVSVNDLLIVAAE
ncbi:MAG: hypothetical protein JWL61_1917 [Gemmatimonadetes bacterium]|nr:hypothetical protein [Gemmatimonadota bacterium]